jgi:ribosomal protein S14
VQPLTPFFLKIKIRKMVSLKSCIIHYIPESKMGHQYFYGRHNQQSTWGSHSCHIYSSSYGLIQKCGLNICRHISTVHKGDRSHYWLPWTDYP